MCQQNLIKDQDTLRFRFLLKAFSVMTILVVHALVSSRLHDQVLLEHDVKVMLILLILAKIIWSESEFFRSLEQSIAAGDKIQSLA